MPTLTIKGSRLLIETDKYSAAVDIEGYVSGVAAGSFVDHTSGMHDPGFGLMIIDFLLEPGREPANTPPELHYTTGDMYHGNIEKRYVALPQICTQAKKLEYEVKRGESFVAVKQWYTWNIGCPPYLPDCRWEQTLLFPDGKRWFLARDRFACTKDSSRVCMRMDMPCHVKHGGDDVFDEIYLSYVPDGSGHIPQTAFHQNFPPQEKFLYRRGREVPMHFIRAIKLTNGPWLAGIALDPSIVYEAWCHQRDYVCMIQEVGGKRTRANQWQNALHLVGWFDSIEEMNAVATQYHRANSMSISETHWSAGRV